MFEDIEARNINVVLVIDIIPFKSVLNEQYARDTSKKIRSPKRTTALNGGFTGSFAPYGYLIDPEVNQKLVIDTEIALTAVKRIFELSKE